MGVFTGLYYPLNIKAPESKDCHLSLCPRVLTVLSIREHSVNVYWMNEWRSIPKSCILYFLRFLKLFPPITYTSICELERNESLPVANCDFLKNWWKSNKIRFSILSLVNSHLGYSLCPWEGSLKLFIIEWLWKGNLELCQVTVEKRKNFEVCSGEESPQGGLTIVFKYLKFYERGTWTGVVWLLKRQLGSMQRTLKEDRIEDRIY